VELEQPKNRRAAQLCHGNEFHRAANLHRLT
jgi:hypothetical protein